MTLERIPGRVLENEHRCCGSDARIDLEHDMIPDPSGDVIAILIGFIGVPEVLLQHSLARQGKRGAQRREKETRI